MIYQELSLAPHLTVMENIVLGVEPTRFGLVNAARDARAGARRARAARARRDLVPTSTVGDAVAGGAAARRDRPRARRRLPRARARRADQQPGARDVRRLFELIGRLKRQGHAIVYISHFIEEVKEVSDRFVVLRDGRNAGGGGPRS